MATVAVPRYAFLHRQRSDMRIRYTVMAAATAVYVATAEIFVMGERVVPHPELGCADAPEDYMPLAVAIQAAALVGFSGWVARSSGRRWVLPTTFHAAVPAALATLIGVPYYRFRMAQAATCSEPYGLCVWCTPHWYDLWWVEVIMASAVATLFGLAAGFVARRVRRNT